MAPFNLFVCFVLLISEGLFRLEYLSLPFRDLCHYLLYILHLHPSISPTILNSDDPGNVHFPSKVVISNTIQTPAEQPREGFALGLPTTGAYTLACAFISLQSRCRSRYSS